MSDITNAIRNFTLKQLANFQGMTYGKIIAHDRAANTADVELLKFTKSPGENEVENVDFPKAYGIPVSLVGGNGNYVSFDFSPGEVVAIAFSASKVSKDGVKSSDLDSFLSKDNAIVLGVIAPSTILTDGLLSMGNPTDSYNVTDDGLEMGNSINNMTIGSSGSEIVSGPLVSVAVTPAAITLTAGTTSFVISAAGIAANIAGVPIDLLTMAQAVLFLQSHVHISAAPGVPTGGPITP